MKRIDSFPKKTTIVSFLVLSLVWTALMGRSNSSKMQDTRASLFKEVDQVMEQAKEAQTDIFSPNQFDSALKNYREADEDYKKGKNLDSIRKKIRAATTFFLKSIETTKLAKIHFSECINARSDALAAEAPAFRNQQWERAESILNDAAKTLEKGKLNDARSKVDEAEQVYRQVELESIKAHYLDETKTLLEAKIKELEKVAPLTYGKAQRSIVMAERLLMENRYDTDEARQFAQQAKYEAQHGLYFTTLIEKMKTEDKTIESLLLDGEKPIQKIADEFDMNAQFHEGYDQPIQSILQGIQSLRKKNASFEQDLRDKEEQISILTDQITQMESQMGEMKSQLGDLKSKEATLTELMEQQRLKREKFTRIEEAFTSKEAQIIREDDKVIIQLYALTFPVGKATIESQYFELLSRVIKAIEEYPEYDITVEGHTDSRGGDAANMKLSTERANAVRDYLVASADIAPPRIKALAYGESKPIASNETEEGRRKNRRITVVIHPKE